MIKPKITKFNWFMYKELLGYKTYDKVRLKLLNNKEILLLKTTFNYWENDTFIIEYVAPSKYESCFQLLGMYLLQVKKIYVYVGDAKYKFRYENIRDRKKLLELFTNYFKEG